MVSEIEHVTIATGSSRMSPRSEVADKVVDKIRAALAGNGALWGGWSVKLVPSPPGMHVYDLAWERMRVCACWLCVDEECSAELWGIASGSGTLPGTRLHPPVRAPWLAVNFAPDKRLVERPDDLLAALGEAGDVQRCVAWALLE